MGAAEIQGGRVPEQKFLDPTTGDEIVRVHWDFGLTSVDVAYGGTLLTKISDITRLRSTGFTGPAPTGGSLRIKLGHGDKFEVDHNDQFLVASDIDPFGHNPTSGTISLADTKVALDNAGRLVVNGQRMDLAAKKSVPPEEVQARTSKAQHFLLFFAIAQIFLAVLVLAVLKLANRVATTTSPPPPPALAGLAAKGLGTIQIVTLASVALVIGTWVLWMVARGPLRRKAFTIAKWIAVLYAAGTGVQLALGTTSKNMVVSVLGATVMACIEFFAFQAFRRAQEVLPRTKRSSGRQPA